MTSQYPGDTDEPSSAGKSAVDMRLLLACFQDEFRADPEDATDLLLDLLLDPITCEARCVMLAKASLTDAGRELRPGGFLAEPWHFVRELHWIAKGQLGAAIESGKASLEDLGELTRNPDVLRLARQALLHGPEVLTELVKLHQAKASRWLWDEVVSGRVRERLGSGVMGKHLAIWKRNQPYEEFVLGEDSRAVRAAAAGRWMLPDTLIAETYADPFGFESATVPAPLEHGAANRTSRAIHQGAR